MPGVAESRDRCWWRAGLSRSRKARTRSGATSDPKRCVQRGKDGRCAISRGSTNPLASALAATEKLRPGQLPRPRGTSAAAPHVGARPTRVPSGSPGQCLAVHAGEVQTARAGLPPCDSDRERPAAPQRRSRANVMFARERKKVVGTLAPTGLSLQGVPLPVHRDAAGIERAGRGAFFFQT